MNMKNKLKKGYCIFSLILATFAICVSVWYASGSTVYASSYGATDNAPNSSDWVTGKGGVSLTLDSDSGSLSANVRILLVITILALAPSILIMLTSFTRIIIVLHFVRSCDRYADIATQPDFDRAGIVFDILYHVADLYADQ